MTTSSIAFVLGMIYIGLLIVNYRLDNRDEKRAETRRRQKKQALENECRDFWEQMNIKNAVNFYEASREAERHTA